MERLFSLVVWLLCVLPVLGQGIEGMWSGQLEAGPQKLRLVVNITKSASGYEGTMDSPDQGAKGIPLSSVTYQSADLMFAIQPLGVVYKGTVSGTQIVGTFTQSGVSFPLIFTRGGVVVNRPQEPKPPYPYQSENITFSSQSPNVRLAGTLTVPQQIQGKCAAVILVSGSGPQNRDGEIFNHKPFLVIADYLTRNGIAVLRYDDRGVGGSNGASPALTTDDFVRDAHGAFDFLLSRKEIDPARIGIIGHSEGGTIAFIAAAQNPKIAFLVSLAGMAIRGDSLMIEQNRDLLITQGLQAGAVEPYCRALGKVFEVVKKESPEYIVQNKERILSDILSEKDMAAVPDPLKQNLTAVLTTSSTPWMKNLLSLDPTRYIKQVKCRVLALNGTRDLQVNAASNLAAIEAALKAGGNKHSLIRKYDGLNHLFQHATTGLPAEYGQIEETIAPVVLEEIKTWIKK